MNKKERDQLAEELKTFLNKKLEGKQYSVVVSFIEDYEEDKSGKITVQTSYIRTGNISITSPHVVVMSVATGFKTGISELLLGGGKE